MDLVPQVLFSKCYPVISPSLMKPKYGDPLKFQFNLAFDLGFPEFTDPDYEHCAMLLDGISDLDVHFDDNLLKPEWPRSKCLSTERMLRRRHLQFPLWKMWPTTNGLDLSLPCQRERKLRVLWSRPIQKPLHVELWRTSSYGPWTVWL